LAEDEPKQISEGNAEGNGDKKKIKQENFFLPQSYIFS